MPIRVTCPEGHRLLVSRRLSGQSVRCPKCHREFVAPTIPTTPAAATTAVDPPRVDSSVPAPAAATAIVTTAGIEPTRHHLDVARHLGLSSVVVATMGAVPVIWHLLEQIQTGPIRSVPNWIYILLTISIMQIGHAIYVRQFPDWSAAGSATLMYLALAMVYAFVVAVFLFASEGNRVIQFLDLTDHFRAPQVRLWCLSMTSLLALFALVVGRVSFRWRLAWRVQFSQQAPPA